MSNHIEQIKKLKQRYEREWLALEEVTAVGIGFVSKDVLGLIVSIKKDATSIQKQIPGEVEGIKVHVQITGEIKAL